MRKILLFATILAALCSLVSCGEILDRKDNYVISFEVQGHITDEEDQDILKDYFDDNFLGEADQITYTGFYVDAYSEAINFFESYMPKVDADFIYSHINDEEDVVYLVCVMAGTSSKEPVASVHWDYAGKESLVTE